VINLLIKKYSLVVRKLVCNFGLQITTMTKMKQTMCAKVQELSWEYAIV
jgi:hypothetical protein